MKVGGQILWNVTPICETSQIYYLMGRRPMKDVLVNHLKDRLFHLVHWLSITLLLRRTSQESITWIVPRIRTVRGWNLEGWRTGCRPWGVGDDGRIGNLLQKTQCKRSNISQRKWKIQFSSRRWTNHTSWRRSRPEKHPPRDGIVQFEEKVALIFLENQKGLFHHFTTRFRMPVKR